MRPPVNVPANAAEIHPWIAAILTEKPQEVEKSIKDRISPDVVGLEDLVDSFYPYRVEFRRGKGYVLLLRKTSKGQPYLSVSDNLYFAEPLAEAALEKRAAFFAPTVRPQVLGFLKAFAGCGEEMEGYAGQFVSQDVSTSEYLGSLTKLDAKWQDSRWFYSARNGDSVLIDQQGRTAWHTFETGDVTPLFDKFGDFVQHYVDFRMFSTDGIFDSWSSLTFRGQR